MVVGGGDVEEVNVVGRYGWMISNCNWWVLLMLLLLLLLLVMFDCCCCFSSN